VPLGTKSNLGNRDAQKNQKMDGFIKRGNFSRVKEFHGPGRAFQSPGVGFMMTREKVAGGGGSRRI